MAAAAAAAAKRLVVLFSPSLPPPERSRRTRGKMISDRCPRSSTRPCALLFLFLPELCPLFLTALFLTFLSLSLSSGSLTRSSTPSYFHAPCLSLPTPLSAHGRSPTLLSPISKDHAARCQGYARDIPERTGYTIASAVLGDIPVLRNIFADGLNVG